MSALPAATPFRPSAILALALSVASFVAAAEEPASDPAERRLAYMRNMVEAFEVVPAGRESPLATMFEREAVLRFGDATRETADGAIWKLGSGRPQVLVATEFSRYDGKQNLNYEFLCLTDEKFTLRTSHAWQWTPAQAALQFQPLADGPRPHESSDIRQLQLKQLARRFSASQKYQGEEYPLRMMAQPIDRYQVEGRRTRQDGAVFVFANGTNPEVLLLVESVAGGWQYGLARMCGAEPTVKLDGEQVWTKPPMEQVGKSWQLDYTGEAHAVDETLLDAVP